MADPERATAALRSLSLAGVGLSIDDFGTGYSSLSHLKNLPVDTLKIDKSFVMNIAHDVDDDRIVQSTVGLAKNLGLRTVAEGVEDPAVLNRLRAMGCDFAQGYHIGRPVPASEILALMTARSDGSAHPSADAAERSLASIG